MIRIRRGIWGKWGDTDPDWAGYKHKVTLSAPTTANGIGPLTYDEGHYPCHPWAVLPTPDPSEAGLFGDLWISREKEQEDHVKHPLAICQPCVHTNLTLCQVCQPQYVRWGPRKAMSNYQEGGDPLQALHRVRRLEFQSWHCPDFEP